MRPGRYQAVRTHPEGFFFNALETTKQRSPFTRIDDAGKITLETTIDANWRHDRSPKGRTL
jgi:hypothetical protein